LAVCFWDPDPARHMVRWTVVAVSAGKRLTVLCPAVHRAAPYISSMCLLRIRKCLVAVAMDMPCVGWGSPCFHDLISRRWSHAASLCHTLPVVSSQDRASTSWVISALNVQSHSCMERCDIRYAVINILRTSYVIEVSRECVDEEQCVKQHRFWTSPTNN